MLFNSSSEAANSQYYIWGEVFIPFVMLESKPQPFSHVHNWAQCCSSITLELGLKQAYPKIRINARVSKWKLESNSVPDIDSDFHTYKHMHTQTHAQTHTSDSNRLGDRDKQRQKGRGLFGRFQCAFSILAWTLTYTDISKSISQKLNSRYHSHPTSAELTTSAAFIIVIIPTART